MYSNKRRDFLVLRTRLIGIKRKPCEVSQIPKGTSLNSDIMRNFSQEAKNLKSPETMEVKR